MEIKHRDASLRSGQNVSKMLHFQAKCDIFKPFFVYNYRDR